MTAPFVIQHADGRRYELDSVAVYKDQFMHQGFAIVDPQPRGRERPDLSEPKAAPKPEPKKADKGHVTSE